MTSANFESYRRLSLKFSAHGAPCTGRYFLSVTLSMEFESDILGEFSESFRFILRGNEEPVMCQFKGHVVSDGGTFGERTS